MPTVFITSASRGLGFEFARQYAAEGWRVIAACRAPERADALRGLAGRVEPVAMDVTDAGAVQAAAADPSPIDLLVNSAGIIGEGGDGPGEVDYARWAHVLDVNTLGPVRVLDALAARLAASERRLAVTITSGMGSLADIGSGSSLMYRTSKAAVNMAMRARAHSLRDRGITVVMINPGWVRTDMGGPNAAIPAEQSVASMRAVLDGLTLADSGRFLNHRGPDYDW